MADTRVVLLGQGVALTGAGHRLRDLGCGVHGRGGDRRDSLATLSATLGRILFAIAGLTLVTLLVRRS